MIMRASLFAQISSYISCRMSYIYDITSSLVVFLCKAKLLKNNPILCHVAFHYWSWWFLNSFQIIFHCLTFTYNYILNCLVYFFTQTYCFGKCMAYIGFAKGINCARHQFQQATVASSSSVQIFAKKAHQPSPLPPSLPSSQFQQT